jgi:epoxide hydrolase-like predicted phosphatase
MQRAKLDPMDETVVGSGELRAILFDLGGVVIDIDFKRAFQIWAALASVDASDLEKRFTFDEAYEQHETGDLQSSAYFNALGESLNVSLSEDDLVAGWNDIYLGTIPGMVKLLATASQRFPLYAFTNSNPTHQSVWSVRFAAELSAFKTIYVSSELGVRKPDPRSFSLVAERMGVQASEVLFFDDSVENVDGAVSAGMRGVVVESTRDVTAALGRYGIEVET